MRHFFKFLFTTFFVATIFLVASFFSSAAVPPPTCYQTNGLQVCHTSDDQSVFYNTPQNEVMYNVQLIRNGSQYALVYHAGPRNLPPPSGSDSIKTTGFFSNYNYTYQGGATFKIWGNDSDPQSLLYRGSSTGVKVSGGGNPMVVRDKNSSYYYMTALAVTDDDRDRNGTENDWRHYLIESRTADFNSFEILTSSGWNPFSATACNQNPASCRPVALHDSARNEIRSNKPDSFGTQGLIGSMALVNGTYYYFYSDWNETNTRFDLYYRTATSISGDFAWSIPTKLSQSWTLGIGTMFRIAKARNMDRWVVMYGCYGQGSQYIAQDICIQYTQDLSITGANGISGLAVNAYTDGYSDLGNKYGLNMLGPGRPADFSQIFWITDTDGNVTVPVQSDSDIMRGGELFWSNFNPAGCNYPGCPVYGGAVWRAGWTVQTVSTPIPGDIDRNGRVDIFDYNILVTNFGRTGTNQADINGDGKVDIFDYNILVRNYGQ